MSTAAPVGPAAIATGCAIGAFIVVVSVVQQMGGGRMWTLVIAEPMLIAIPVIVLTVTLPERPPLTDLLGLRRPALVFVVAGLLIGVSQWIWNLAIANALADHLPPSPTSSEAMTAIVVEPPLALSLFAIALVPAVCEEVVFRGVLARGLATRFVPAFAVGASALLFSAFHMSLAQAIPTLTLGVVYAVLALRARSAIPSIIAHLINNGMAVLASRKMLTSLFEWIVDDPGFVIGGAVGITALGVALIVRGAR